MKNHNYGEDLNKHLIKCGYYKTEEIGDNFLRVWLNDKCGVVDENGEIVIPIIYDNVYYVENNLFVVSDNNLCGLRSSEKFIIHFGEYDELKGGGNGFVIARLDKEYGIINIK